MSVYPDRIVELPTAGNIEIRGAADRSGAYTSYAVFYSELELPDQPMGWIQIDTQKSVPRFGLLANWSSEARNVLEPNRIYALTVRVWLSNGNAEDIQIKCWIRVTVRTQQTR